MEISAPLAVCPAKRFQSASETLEEKKAKRQILIERSIKRNIDIRSDNLGVLSASIEAS